MNNKAPELVQTYEHQLQQVQQTHEKLIQLKPKIDQVIMNCVCMCVHVHVHICMYMYILTYICRQVFVCSYIHVYV